MKREKSKRKSTGADAIRDVAGGIHAMSDTFGKVFGASTDSTEDKLDIKRTAAIRDMAALVQFSAGERGTLARLFGDDMAVSCYLAIPLDDMKEPFLRELLSIEEQRRQKVV